MVRKILNMLESLDLKEEVKNVRAELFQSSISKRDRLLKRLRLLETF